MNKTTQEALFGVMRGDHSLIFAGAHFDESNDRCPFIQDGSVAIGWEGSLSPCLPLLHNHVTYLNGWKRLLKRHVVGNVGQRDLKDLWNAPDYIAFRKRVQGFNFSPCMIWEGCDLSLRNRFFRHNINML